MRSTMRFTEVLRRATPALPITVVVGAIIGLLAAHAQHPTYQAFGQIQLISASQLGVTDSTADDGRSLATLRSFVLSDAVIDQTAKALKLDADDVRNAVDVVASSDADILVVTATEDSAHQAGEVARAIIDTTVSRAADAATSSLTHQADALLAEAQRLRTEAQQPTTAASLAASDVQTADALDRSRADLLVRIQAVAAPAVALLRPEDPVGSQSIGALPLAVGGAFVALLIGAGVVLLRGGDPDLLNGADLEPGQLIEGTQVLARIPSRWSWPAPPRLPTFSTLAGSDEGVTVVMSTRGASPVRSVLVASIDRGVGRSTLTAALAVTASRLGLRTLVVDADLRQAGAEQFVAPGQDHGPGLLSVLQHVDDGGRSVREVLGDAIIHDDTFGLDLLAAGPEWWEAVDLVQRLPTREVMAGLHAGRDLVLIDSAALPVPETLRWAGGVDGILLLAAEGTTSRRRLQQTMSQLTAVGGRVIGIVGVPSPSRQSRRPYSAVPRTPVVVPELP